MKNLISNSFFVSFLLFALSVLTQNQSFAQANVIHELETGNTFKKVSAKANTSKIDKSRGDFNTFSKKLYTTLYYENGVLKNKHGQGDAVRISLDDMSSFETLVNNNTNFNEVKLISITLKNKSELNSVIDLQSLSGFSNLSYVFLKCHFDCNASEIENAVINSNHTIRIFYSYVIPN